LLAASLNVLPTPFFPFDLPFFIFWSLFPFSSAFYLLSAVDYKTRFPAPPNQYALLLEQREGKDLARASDSIIIRPMMMMMMMTSAEYYQTLRVASLAFPAYCLPHIKIA
jgi:hypothetical protein